MNHWPNLPRGFGSSYPMATFGQNMASCMLQAKVKLNDSCGFYTLEHHQHAWYITLDLGTFALTLQSFYHKSKNFTLSSKKHFFVYKCTFTLHYVSPTSTVRLKWWVCHDCKVTWQLLCVVCKIRGVVQLTRWLNLPCSPLWASCQLPKITGFQLKLNWNHNDSYCCMMKYKLFFN